MIRRSEESHLRIDWFEESDFAADSHFLLGVEPEVGEAQQTRIHR
jgi:hypothetical protein